MKSLAMLAALALPLVGCSTAGTGGAYGYASGGAVQHHARDTLDPAFHCGPRIQFPSCSGESAGQ